MEIFLLFLVVVLLASFANLFDRAKRRIRKTQYHYTKRNRVMTSAEGRFFESLSSVLGDRFIVIPQAHLSAFIDHKVVGQYWKGALSAINAKSVDFLLVDKHTLEPMIAIELDDWSHEREDRVARDARVEQLFNEVGMLFARFDDPDIDGQEIVEVIYDLVREQPLNERANIEQKSGIIRN